eukprot:c289_g1_i1 orf=87-287(-)
MESMKYPIVKKVITRRGICWDMKFLLIKDDFWGQEAVKGITPAKEYASLKIRGSRSISNHHTYPPT